MARIRCVVTGTGSPDGSTLSFSTPRGVSLSEFSIAAFDGGWVGNLAGRPITSAFGAGPTWSLQGASP
jgi:hypothetical protein